MLFSGKIYSLAFSLFLLMDSIGNIPIYIAILKNYTQRRQRKIILRELVIALAIILVFCFIGDFFLSFLNVKQHTVLIAGGIILFLIALKMIFPINHTGGAEEYTSAKEPFIVPLAVPLIAGPAVLAAVMLYSKQESLFTTVSAIVIAWIASTIILLSSSLLKRLLGSRGLIACERLMGLVLTLIAVQMFLEGISAYVSTCHMVAEAAL